jgi:hypothetical protein
MVVFLSYTWSIRQRWPNSQLWWIVWSIVATFWSQSKAIHHLNMNNSCIWQHFWNNLPLQRSLFRMKIIKSRYRSHLTDEHMNYCFTCAKVIMNPLSVRCQKICHVMHHLLSRKVNEKHAFIMVNCFSLTRSVSNKWNNSNVICLML